MKKVIALVLVMVLAMTCFAGCGKEEDKLLEKVLKEGKIKFATSPDFAPFEFKDLEGNVVGGDVELAKYIADYLGVELEILPMDFAACQTAVYTGKVDFSISGYAQTPERAENATFSVPYNLQPVVGEEQGILVKKENADKLNSAEAFAGMKIAAQSGSLQYTLVTEQTPDAQVEQISEINTGTMMLLSDKVDGLASSIDTGKAIIDVNPGLTFSDFYYTVEKSGSVALIVKGEMSLKAKIDEAILKAESEGLFKVWMDKSNALMDEVNG